MNTASLTIRSTIGRAKRPILSASIANRLFTRWLPTMAAVCGIGLGFTPSKADAADFAVTTTADAGAGSLRQAIIDANTAGGSNNILFQGAAVGATITLVSELPVIATNVAIDAAGATVSGGNTSRVFFVGTGSAVTVSLANVTIASGAAKGGDGGAGYGGGGGGLGAGGGLFVNDQATVTISNVAFQSNAATGGKGGLNGEVNGGGGGGGLGGSGGSVDNPFPGPNIFGGNGGGGGGGGFGTTATGGTGGAAGGGAGLPGAAGLAASGSAAGNGQASNAAPGGTGGATGGGGGSGAGGIANVGGGGGGGGIGGQTGVNTSAGGQGGDFGGGGGAGGSNSSVGGNGGFGGGGGGALSGSAGSGGYGGGGGGGFSAPNSQGGFGGGSGSAGNSRGGGGGAGFGGAIFVRSGGSLIVQDSSTQGGSVAGGTAGAGATVGQAAGAGFFLAGSGTLGVSVTAGTQTLADQIADEAGLVAAGYTPPAGFVSGSWALNKTGAGTLTLAAANTYTGATRVDDGTLKLGINNALPTATVLTLNNVAGSGTAIFDLDGRNQALAGLTFTAGDPGAATVNLRGGTLTLNGDVNLVDDTTFPGNRYGATIEDNGNAASALDLGGAVRTFNIAGQNVANQELIINAPIQNGGVIINALNSSSQGNSAGVIFTGANTYAGGTTITSGFLLANNAAGSATGTGPVAINAGGSLGGNGTVTGPVTLNSGGFIAPGQNGPGSQATLTAGSLIWNGGGQLNLELGAASDQLALTGAFTKGTAGAFTVDVEDAGGILNQNQYTLVTFGSNVGFAAADFTLSTLVAGLTGTFSLDADSLDLLLSFATTGALIQNVGGPNTPLIADFTVDGAGTTGAPADDNTINSLLLTPGSTLEIFNQLTVTSGDVGDTGPGSTGIFGGTLYGPNGLFFNVQGDMSVTSTLLGNLIKTGGGSLFLNGNLQGNLQVLAGLFGGNANIFGNLVNSGIVSPGNSPGTINVSGNYTQTSAGTLRIEIGGRSAGQYDLLAVGGTAQLDGTLQLVRLNKFKLKRGDTITFLTAGQGVDGEFAAVENAFTSDTILEPTVVYGDNSVALEMVQGSFADFAGRAGLTPNQRAVAGALDSAASDSAANPLFDYLDYQPLGELPGDFDKIAPEELTSIFTISTSLATVQGINLQRRTDDLRQGSSGFSASGLAMQGTGPGYSGGLFGVAGPTGKETKEMKQVLPEEKKWGAFLTGVGEWVDVDGDGNARGYDISTGGFTLGLDYKLCPNFAIGIAAGYAGTAADLTDDGRVWVNGGKLGIYATAFVGGWYADAAVGGGYNSYDTRRSALQGTARGSTDGGELNVLVGTGYDWKIGALTIGPTATFQYTLVGIDGFTEHGSLAPLTIDGQNVESVRTTLGIKASFDWKIGKVIVRPELRAAWQHEYGDNSYGLDASFANGAGGSFLVNGPEIGRDSLLLGAGVAIQCTERCSTYFYYDGELGRSNYGSNAVSGGIRIAF